MLLDGAVVASSEHNKVSWTLLSVPIVSENLDLQARARSRMGIQDRSISLTSATISKPAMAGSFLVYSWCPELEVEGGNGERGE